MKKKAKTNLKKSNTKKSSVNKSSLKRSSVKKKSAQKTAKKVVKNDDFGIASLILGIISILPFIGINLVAGVLGIVFGSKQRSVSDSQTAKIGIILSIIGLSLWFIIFVFAMIFLFSFISFFAYASV